MDLHSALGQFFDEKGAIKLAPHITLAGLGEMLYQADSAAGGQERTVLDFWEFGTAHEGAHQPSSYTRKEVNTRIKATASRLQHIASVGDKIVILANNSPEYLFGFIGALYAGMVPIPLYDPREPGHADHLSAVLGDSKPAVVLTNTASAAAVRSLFAHIPARQRPRIIAIDALPDTLAVQYTPVESSTIAGQQALAPIDMPAFLQYTSGSTRVPAGVILTNRSIVTNVLQIFTAAKLKTPLRIVSWLPLHHDMGIILATFVVLLGIKFDLMAPRDFVQQPQRWIRQLHRRKDDGHIYSVVPNFALEMSARYGLPQEGEELDLSAIDGLIIGSEPVTQKAVESFVAAFSPYGLETNVLRPSYGLAEASLLVTTPQTDRRPLISHFDRDALAQGRAVLTAESESSVAIASCGQVVRPQYLTIVDPETKQELEDGMIGELWAHGENMAAGYLDRPEDTAATFANTLSARLAENSRVHGAPHDGWMASGDLAVIVDNEVYITGRLKDLIIIAGRNHYPQDIEYTVEHSSAHIRPAATAAFAIESEDVEQLIILAERDVNAQAHDDAAAIEAIRAAVSDAHGIVPADIRIMAPDAIARSSSGKIARRVNKKNYLQQ
ncbi:acyl-CoA synthase [Corynebacterium sp. sy017]|uniref:FadD32-like long-chain-fatty-acid--AMP ligase n=1 Tax=unclassified Corynebacterium TaxID=2624378 RepID=UPI001185318A|nr:MULTISPECIES: FadD32-like long-chain-fatty-acid--AMP ligase [unclassified Corynebacterium]MBP3088524.1 acyl-CoA synthase [Corynebacterium sp. sy017]TSD91829.1 acyl-CoA synthase [Corynebacterium sp. SY003]